MAMEHEIPQNVTSFQFRLVGNMTLKQFSFLASGSAIAYLSFLLITPLSFMLSWIIIIPSVFLGFAFAFMPIADRPLDHWLIAFLKAVYSPTQRIWYKKRQSFDKQALFTQRFLVYSQAQNLTHNHPLLQAETPPTLPTKLDQPKSISSAQNGSSDKLPSKEELAQTVELAKVAQTLQHQIIDTEKRLNQITAEAMTQHAPPQIYTQEINTILDNLQRLVSQATTIKRQLNQLTHTPSQNIPQQKVRISKVPPIHTLQKHLTLTTFPNVVNGVAVDANGDYLENVVVVIYDKEGLPVRALKTNKLGQFTGSTPLPNGTYSIEFEKENLVFDVLQIELEGNILPPLSIAAKKLVGSS